MSDNGHGRVSPPEATAPAASKRGLRRVIAASFIGTTIEWYDFFLFGSAAALVFGDLFFPSFSPLAGTLLAFGTYAVGFAARPLGGLVFGHFGDRIGRKSMLVATLLLMGVATFCVGLLPTYESIGVAAPILLVTLRFMQGLGVGGEWGGAVLMASEHGHAGKRGLYASWPQAGVPIGNLLAVGVLAIFTATLSDSAFESWGWRVPFLLSAILVVVGLYVRLRIAESPLFQAVADSETKARVPILDVLKVYPRSVLIAMGARFAENVCYYVFTLFVLTYATEEVGLSKAFVLNAVLAASAIHFLAILAWGAASDRVGRRPIYLFGAAGVGIWGFVFFPLADTGSFFLIMLAVTGGLIFHAAMYGPQAAFFSELFGTRVRYSGASIGYQLASVFAGSLAPIIAVALLAEFGSALPVSLYLLGASLLTLVAVALVRETKGVDLRVAKAEEAAVVESPEAFRQRRFARREATPQGSRTAEPIR